MLAVEPASDSLSSSAPSTPALSGAFSPSLSGWGRGKSHILYQQSQSGARFCLLACLLAWFFKVSSRPNVGSELRNQVQELHALPTELARNPVIFVFQ